MAQPNESAVTPPLLTLKWPDTIPKGPYANHFIEDTMPEYTFPHTLTSPHLLLYYVNGAISDHHQFTYKRVQTADEARAAASDPLVRPLLRSESTVLWVQIDAFGLVEWIFPLCQLHPMFKQTYSWRRSINTPWTPLLTLSTFDRYTLFNILVDIDTGSGQPVQIKVAFPDDYNLIFSFNVDARSVWRPSKFNTKYYHPLKQAMYDAVHGTDQALITAIHRKMYVVFEEHCDRTPDSILRVFASRFQRLMKAHTGSVFPGHTVSAQALVVYCQFANVLNLPFNVPTPVPSVSAPPP